MMRKLWKVNFESSNMMLPLFNFDKIDCENSDDKPALSEEPILSEQSISE